MHFEGKAILVTGASEGIGRALALSLAPERPKLVLAARSAGRLESLATECRALGAAALVVPVDVTDRLACERLVHESVAQYGQLDVLVANAGGTMWSRFDALADLGIFEQLMRLNFHANVWLTAAALPHLYRSRGLIVAVASVAGLTGVPERTAYAASKHALVGFCESLRIEIAPRGVDVTIVAPDFVLSEIHKRAIGPDGRPLGASPLRTGRVMTAAECARRMHRAMARRDRLLITSLRGRAGRVLKLVAPRLIDRIVRRAIRERH
ncbi:MAG: SDR family oxidoreductase [Steroidobacteraceae bacterium]